MDSGAILAVLATLLVAAITAIIDVARRPGEAFNLAGTSKALTLTGLLLSGGVGGIYYWLVLRRRLSAATLPRS